VYLWQLSLGVVITLPPIITVELKLVPWKMSLVSKGATIFHVHDGWTKVSMITVMTLVNSQQLRKLRDNLHTQTDKHTLMTQQHAKGNRAPDKSRREPISKANLFSTTAILSGAF